MISFARIDIGRGGLPTCPLCGRTESAAMRPTQAVLADARAAASALDRGPGPNIWLAGADAFAHPDLPRLVTEILDLGVERLKVSTAGPALAVGDNAGGSIEAGVRQVEFVLCMVDQPADADAHTTGFAAVAEGMAAYGAAASALNVPVALTGRVPVCPHSHSQTPETVAALASAGATAVTVELPPDAPLPDPSWLSAVLNSGVVNRAWVQFEGLRGDAETAWTPLAGVTVSEARAWSDREVPA